MGLNCTVMELKPNDEGWLTLYCVVLIVPLWN